MQGHLSSVATMMIVPPMLLVLEGARAARVCAAGVPLTAAGTYRTSGVATTPTNDHALVLHQRCPRRPSGTADLSTATCTGGLWLALVLVLALATVMGTALAPPRSAAIYRSRVLCADPLSVAHS